MRYDPEAGVMEDDALPYLVGFRDFQQGLDNRATAITETLRNPQEHFNRLVLAGGVAGAILLAAGAVVRVKYT